MGRIGSDRHISVFCQWVIIRMILIMLVVVYAPRIILAQEPTPTPGPDEFIATKIEDIVGAWEQHFMSGVAYIQYQADGTWKLAYTVKDLETRPMMNGTFWFEGTVFTTKDNYGQGTYEVRVKKEGGRAVHLAFSVIEDPLHDRIRDLSAGMTRVDRYEEFIVNKVEDLVGIWETRHGVSGAKAYIQYEMDGTFRKAYTIENLPSSPLFTGNFWFESNVYCQKENHPLASEFPGKYEVRIRKAEGMPDQLSFRMIEDPDKYRVKDLTAGMSRVEP